MHDLNFDYEAFLPRLLGATRHALTWEKAQYADETFYAFGVYGSAGWGYLVPFCCTEEGLTRVATSYLEAHGTDWYPGRSLDEMRLDLRFSLADTGHSSVFDHAPYSTDFEEINNQLWHRSDAIDRLSDQFSEHDADSIFVVEDRRFKQVCYRVFRQLDDEGLFGRGVAREQVTVIATNGNSDLDPSTFGDAIRDLNPPSVYEAYDAFRHSWLQLLERWQAQQRQHRKK